MFGSDLKQSIKTLSDQVVELKDTVDALHEWQKEVDARLIALADDVAESKEEPFDEPQAL